MRTPAEYEAEIDRFAAALDLEAKARLAMAEAYEREREASTDLARRLGLVRSDLIGLQAATNARLAMVDLDSPMNACIVRGTIHGIANLERTLEERFNEGRAVGRAEAELEAERLSA